MKHVGASRVEVGVFSLRFVSQRVAQSAPAIARIGPSFRAFP
jgi:hypothetical protein